MTNTKTLDHNKKTGVFIRKLDYEKIAALRAAGKSYADISHEMHCSATAIAYAVKQMGLKTNAKRRKK